MCPFNNADFEVGSWSNQTFFITKSHLFEAQEIISAIMPVVKPAAGPTTAPASYKQPSRKGKKAWRKNVDVTEVEEGLDELNEEILKG